MGSNSILVVGGGISGITAAVEASEVGYEVFLLEKRPYLGGRVTQLNQYFPKLCPPNCGLEINLKRIKNSPYIKFFTQAEVEEITGQEGNFTVKVRLSPRFVTDKCTACGKCTEVCPVERTDEFNYALGKTKAIYLPQIFAFPFKYAIDAQACEGEKCGKCLAACPYGAIDLKMQPETMTLEVGAIIWATGWQPYDLTKLEQYGAGRYKNVITNVQMERLAATDGPTGGQILRPSDGKAVSRIAFVQCAGSRDENHLPFCSAVCCMASLKQVTYVREKHPDAEISIFFIDIRALGRHEDFFNRVKDLGNINLIKGKVGTITEDDATKDVTVQVEDQEAGRLLTETFDMVVLATGMEPTSKHLPFELPRTPDGFLADTVPGIYGAGCVKRPLDVAGSVQDATAAALKAIQSVVGR
ncbi:MAG TPA: CoB--CoM heterodisulfide reductase iron-sulfur subunit A family protein [Desulfotomaculum sp.]|nr:CoB--CoM heterodisulfide reductase iron-sulfur subunit A family protein [Desulfotomaculum sp.]